MNYKPEILIPSHNRSEAISTPQLLGKEFADRITIIVNDYEQLQNYRKNKSLDPFKIVTSGVVGNVANHQWKLRNLMEKGKWYICLDDDIHAFCCVPRPYFDNEEILLPVKTSNPDYLYSAERDESLLKGGVFNTEISGADYIEKMEWDIENICEPKGINLLGTATNDNRLFRRVKYKNVGLTQHQCFAMKKTELEYDENICIREEWDMTIQYMVRDGAILRNDYLFVKRKHYEQGGIGNFASRRKGYISDANYLINKYPELVGLRDKENDEAGTEIRLLKNGTNFAQWRDTYLNQSTLF